MLDTLLAFCRLIGNAGGFALIIYYYFKVKKLHKIIEGQDRVIKELKFPPVDAKTEYTDAWAVKEKVDPANSGGTAVEA